MGTEEPLSLTEAQRQEATHRIQRTFIHLKDDFRITSPEDPEYNCVAWAAGDTSKNWWPTGDWWPPNAQKQRTVEAFVTVFRDLGYELCNNGKHEIDIEKVVLFTYDGRPTHMARQFATSGRWTSKSGVLHDIAVEDLEGLTGGKIGRIECFMKRAAVSPTVKKSPRKAAR